MFLHKSFTLIVYLASAIPKQQYTVSLSLYKLKDSLILISDCFEQVPKANSSPLLKTCLFRSTLPRSKFFNDALCCFYLTNGYDVIS